MYGMCPGYGEKNFKPKSTTTKTTPTLCAETQKTKYIGKSYWNGRRKLLNTRCSLLLFSILRHCVFHFFPIFHLMLFMYYLYCMCFALHIVAIVNNKAYCMDISMVSIRCCCFCCCRTVDAHAYVMRIMH